MRWSGRSIRNARVQVCGEVIVGYFSIVNRVDGEQSVQLVGERRMATLHIFYIHIVILYTMKKIENPVNNNNNKNS